MLFHSFQFFVFFIVVYILYLALPHRWQNRMLLAASYVFYGAWDWRYLSLILLSTVVDYFCGLKLEKLPKGKKKRSFLILSIVVNLSLLFTFKYYDFFAGNFQNLMGYFGVSVYPYFLNVVLPVGISFYTFQTMSYTVDVYRGKLPAARNFFDFALYVSFFPQLVAGPIERGTRLLPALLNRPPHHYERKGCRRGIPVLLGTVSQGIHRRQSGDDRGSGFCSGGSVFRGDGPARRVCIRVSDLL